MYLVIKCTQRQTWLLPGWVIWIEWMIYNCKIIFVCLHELKIKHAKIVFLFKTILILYYTYYVLWELIYYKLIVVTCLSGAEAIEWISKAFVDDSALLKHELAYCLGQMQDKRAIPTLTAVLKDTQQEPMVRHEAGEHAHIMKTKRVTNKCTHLNAQSGLLHTCVWVCNSTF